MLGNPKDKTKNSKKSGIYETHCNGCNGKFYDQTRRAIKVRHIKYPRRTKIIKYAHHLLNPIHSVDKSILKLQSHLIKQNNYDNL